MFKKLVVVLPMVVTVSLLALFFGGACAAPQISSESPPTPSPSPAPTLASTPILVTDLNADCADCRIVTPDTASTHSKSVAQVVLVACYRGYMVGLSRVFGPTNGELVVQKGQFGKFGAKEGGCYAMTARGAYTTKVCRARYCPPGSTGTKVPNFKITGLVTEITEQHYRVLLQHVREAPR